jgi:hypothetical protein
MASDNKKSVPAPKSEPATKKLPDAKKKDAVDTAKPDATEKAADAPSSYSRGEGQKPVSQAYKDNWNAIFGTKKKKKKR